MKKFYTITIGVAALLIIAVSAAIVPRVLRSEKQLPSQKPLTPEEIACFDPFEQELLPQKPLTPEEIACFDFLQREMPLFTDYVANIHPSRVTMVEFQYNYGVTGAGFSVLKSLPNLEELNCHNAHNLNDSFADCLQYLPKLKKLNLTGTQVTPKSLLKIAKLKQLESLRIIRRFARVEDTAQWGADDTFTNASLEILAECSQLKHLYIGEPCDISDIGLEQLKHFPNLEYLGIVTDKVTPKGVAFLKTLPHIKEINIVSTAANRPNQHSVIVNGDQRITFVEPNTRATP